MKGLLFRSWEPAFRRRLSRICSRGETTSGRVERDVRRIIAAVRRGGDDALLSLTLRHDRVRMRRGALRVPPRVLAAATRRLDPRALADLRFAARRIAAFHRRQRERSWRYRDATGLVLGQKIEPLGRVGVYVPGGRAPYPSTVLMNVIPAKVAGVKEVIAVSPPQPGGCAPSILAAAHVAGVDAFFQVGGAQAVSALAFGTRTIPAVDKIVGPGNIYVATAKRLVFGQVGIDLVAGPSEILVVADESARPDLIAADMLSQAEHDELSAAVCVTPSAALAADVVVEVGMQLAKLPRRGIAARALRAYGAVVQTRTLGEAIDLANKIAPEHLELAVKRPERWMGAVHHAGAIFLGHSAPEALGDYVAGPNHVLPTGGTARFASPLGVYDFVKRSSVIKGTPGALRRLGPAVERLAAMEGLTAHGHAVRRRLTRRPGASSPSKKSMAEGRSRRSRCQAGA